MSLILAALAAVLASLAWRTGVTVDEPAHVLSAARYWAGEDDLLPGDMPPLIKILGGWMPLRMGLPVPEPGHPSWKQRHEWPVAQEMMTRFRGEDLRWVFFLARLPMILFPLLCAGLAWWWGRQLFSPAVGVLLALVISLSPTMLAHGALFKNDAACAFAYLLFCYRTWRYWQRPGLANAAWLGGAALLGLLAKFTLILLVLAIPLLLGIRAVWRRTYRPRTFLWQTAAALGVVYAGIVVLFPGSLTTIPEPMADFWRARFSLRPIPIDWVSFAQLVPVPERFLDGVHSVIAYFDGNSAVYLLGDLHPGGHPYYFLVALAVKTASGFLLLVGLGILSLGMWFLRRDPRWRTVLWLGLPALLYLALASATPLQAGVRLVLPAIVCLVVLTGAGMQWLLHVRGGRVVLVAILLWFSGRTATAYPHYLAHFNVFAGGADAGLRYLSDSNLDWGQGLPDLAVWLEAHPEAGVVNVSYFGFDKPEVRLPANRFRGVAPPWDPRLAPTKRLDPQPGYWAISASLLTGHLFASEFRDYYQAFREATPVAKAGYSIFIYKF